MKKIILDRNFKDGIQTLCKKCGEWECECNNLDSIESNKNPKIKIEIKKVNNKTLSIIYPLYRKDIKEILKELKKSLGCGGKIVVMDNYYQINLQGDVREKARGILKYKFNLNI